ncbi:cytochrome P450 4c3 [Trichonephila inaurata madagascariensis]|uniref:Cytochrome P450 4c3 n=1 Tax=Trichonephila inaurata madagascariensis TaxID=2747483 RepID=A0A8X6YP88_9ARAC|nr:cytochrome P450 4c3 [Trichonephila inaurata madagascariensis]
MLDEYKVLAGSTAAAEEKHDLYNQVYTSDLILYVGDIFMSRVLKFWEWSDFIFDMTSGREAKRHAKLIDDFIKSAIKKKMKEYLSGNKDDKRKRKTFINLLLELHFETQELSEEDLCAEVKTHISAGYETVSDTMTWALYLIGLYPDVQEKIHEELDGIFGSDVDRCATENDLNDLKYLDCVLKETQRLYSVVPMIARDIKEDSNICKKIQFVQINRYTQSAILIPRTGGYPIRKGSTCVILSYFLHRDKEVFPDPEKFDPDRFLPENAVNIPEFGFIPFSAGPRNCIGQKFAVMEMKTTVSHILRNYNIESLDSRDKVLPIMKITLHPSIPIRIRIRPRRNRKAGETA